MLALFGPIIGFSVAIPILAHFGAPSWGAFALAALGAAMQCSVICPESVAMQPKWLAQVLLVLVMPWSGWALYVGSRRRGSNSAVSAIVAPLIWSTLFVIAMLIGDVTGLIPQ